MSQEGLYIQVAGHGLAVGWDTNEGFAFSYFTEAALGVQSRHLVDWIEDESIWL